MGRWTDAGSHWTYSPYLEGNEDPNKPPPGVEFKEGDPYNSTNGKKYKTYLVKMEVKAHNSPFGHLLNSGDDPDRVVAVVWQQIVDWSAPIE